MGRETLIRQLRIFKRKVSKHHKVNRLLFFGSRATGHARPDSDVDLIIVSTEFAGKSLIQRATHFYLDWNLDYPVEFLCYTPQEFQQLAKRPSIVQEALKTGVII